MCLDVSEPHPSDCGSILLGHPTFFWPIIVWGSFGWFHFLDILKDGAVSIHMQGLCRRASFTHYISLNGWLLWWLYLWPLEELPSLFPRQLHHFCIPHPARRTPVSPLTANPVLFSVCPSHGCDMASPYVHKFVFRFWKLYRSHSPLPSGACASQFPKHFQLIVSLVKNTG